MQRSSDLGSKRTTDSKNATERLDSVKIWLQPFNQLIFLLLAVFVVALPSPPWVFVAAAASGWLLDWILDWIQKRKRRLVASVAGLNTGFSTSFMLGATAAWPILLAVLVAIVQKHLFRRTIIGHIFNPSNLGILFALLVFPHMTASLMPSWGNITIVQVAIFILGMITLSLRGLVGLYFAFVAFYFGFGYLIESRSFFFIF